MLYLAIVIRPAMAASGLELRADRWNTRLTMLYTDYQMNTSVFWPEDDRERQSRIFAEDVVPAVRAALADAG